MRSGKDQQPLQNFFKLFVPNCTHYAQGFLQGKKYGVDKVVIMMGQINPICQANQGKHNIRFQHTIMTTTAETTWLSNTPLLEELGQIIEDNERKSSEDFVWYELDEADESPNECYLTFFTKDFGTSRLVISGDETKITVEHFVRNIGKTEVTPQVWSLGEDLEILMDRLAEKHNVEITYGDNHGKQI
jgi:hypothetical protein